MTPPTRTLRALCALALALALGAAARAQPPVVAVPRLTHPGAGQVIYFVLTDRFCNGSTANDTGGIQGGPEATGFDPTRIRFYHGGDLAGLTAKLDYIKGLGATAIWITPPFRNQVVHRNAAGYHGYWILDFTAIDPHLGTQAQFRQFVEQAHARGIRVYLDIVVNHTADIIHYRDGSTKYISIAEAPYRDASGRPFDSRALAYNGVNSPDAFPTLSAERSFAHVPVIAPANAHAKTPDWLNDVTLYHNRGNSTFKGESSLDGDFGGLDDVFTENPRVVRGFIDVYAGWIERYGIDGFRIDTVKHVNIEFWQAFAPAIRERARRAGRPAFVQFGEAANGDGNVALMSYFSTTGGLDGMLDFGFQKAARDFVSRGGTAAQLAQFFATDAMYTDHDSNVQTLTTFISNHDDGRFGFFLRKDNPSIGADLMARKIMLAYDLLLTSRGQPALYYGDEQGMVGTGWDAGSREDMFASRSPEYARQALLGTTRTGADDKFDTRHPFYRALAALCALRTSSPGLSTGATITRASASPNLFAFSRIERAERVEYLVALNNSEARAAGSALATCQPAGALFTRVFDSLDPGPAAGKPLEAGAGGTVSVSLEPMQCVVWKAQAPLAPPASAPSVALATPLPGATLSFTADSVDGHEIPVRQEIRAEVSGGDGFAEVTFALARASRPGQYELLGTADAPPYRVFWRPPADLAPGEKLAFIATVDDLRGHRASAQATGIRVAPSGLSFGIRGASVPTLVRQPDASVEVREGSALELSVLAAGTGPLDYAWLHDGSRVAGAAGAVLRIGRAAAADAGGYVALVHGPEGTAISREAVVRVER